MGSKEQDGERFTSCLQYEEASVVQNVLCQTTSEFKIGKIQRKSVHFSKLTFQSMSRLSRARTLILHKVLQWEVYRASLTKNGQCD